MLVCRTHPDLEEPLLVTHPIRMYELLVGLHDINVIGIGGWSLCLRIAITTRPEPPVCTGCGGAVVRTMC